MILSSFLPSLSALVPALRSDFSHANLLSTLDILFLFSDDVGNKVRIFIVFSC